VAERLGPLRVLSLLSNDNLRPPILRRVMLKCEHRRLVKDANKSVGHDYA